VPVIDQECSHFDAILVVDHAFTNLVSDDIHCVLCYFTATKPKAIVIGKHLFDAAPDVLYPNRTPQFQRLRSTASCQTRQFT
jgi:hypothetical protein